MNVLISVALLVLTVAVVLLFAMLGELASRLSPSHSAVAASDRVDPLPQIEPGTRPSRWIGPFAGKAPQFVVVFSTSCSTCVALAEDRQALMTSLESGDARRSGGLVLSCPDREDGEDFVSKYGLSSNGIQVVIDENGEWLRSEFGLDLSPSVILFEDGKVEAAYGFRSLAGLNKILVNGDH